MLTTRTNIKIRGSVVGFDLVDVMHYFTSAKVTTDDFFDYKTMHRKAIVPASERMLRSIKKSISSTFNLQVIRLTKFSFMFFREYSSLWSWGRLKFTSFSDFFFRFFRVWMTLFSFMEKSKTDTRAKPISFSMRGVENFFASWTDFNHTSSIPSIGYYGNTKI